MVSTSLGDDELQPGRVIERYEVEARLGAGAMAAVYRVKHTTLGTHYALKLLTIGHSRQLKQRMIQEGRNQAQLEHRNIVRVFDVIQVDGMPALIMEYVSGGALDEWLEENQPTVEQAESIFRGITAGVAEAHRMGLVHRDLKPANILMQDRDDLRTPKVADFGIAKAWADDSAVSLTRSGVAMGTPQYMAPEQAMDASDVDHRADIFALGCILYELVCGRKAFEGDNLPTIFNLVLSGDYRAPNELSPDLPPRVLATIEGCLKVDPAERFQDCDAILECLSTEPVAKPAPAPTSMAPQALSELPDAGKAGLAVGGLLAIAGLGSAALAAVLVGAFFLFNPGQPAEPGDTDEPSADVEEGDTDTPEEEPVHTGRGTCTGPAGQIVGYANVRGVFVYKKGMVWYPIKAQPVFADYPRKENNYSPDTSQTVCSLPQGAAVSLRHDPMKIRGGGFWIPIDGSSMAN